MMFLKSEKLPPKETLLKMYSQMLQIRRFEERSIELYREGLVRALLHPYLGQEAVAVGVCSALEEKDYITSTHRGHGHCLAKGARLAPMMAEILGKRTGYCQGKGGSMHIADLEKGILGANGIVGGGIPIAAGSALSALLKKSGQVTACFFGDGASNQGSFHESLNLAAIWALPVIFVCENNGYALSTPVKESLLLKDIAERALAYGMAQGVVDGNDVLAVYEAAQRAIERARSGHGPTLLEAKTYRWEGHYYGDKAIYRSQEEVEQWKKKDPLAHFRSWLLEQKQATPEELGVLEEEVEAELKEAVDFALTSPEPSVEEASQGVYVGLEPDFENSSLAETKDQPSQVTHLVSSQPRPTRSQEEPPTREITFAQAIGEALAEEMEKDESVILIGEDIGLQGGAFGVTKGLLAKFGPARVRGTPISEAAIVGAAVGAALTGLRPVAEIMYIDFITLAMDQIVNQAAKIPYMYGGRAKVPLVIRTQGGGGRGNAAQHSQSLEAWFCHIPGLLVVMPSSPYEAKGLLKSAIRDDNPVIFIEHKLLYATTGPVPEEEYLIPLGQAAIKRKGDHLTIIATSHMVSKALVAAEILAQEGIEAEVIDPRTLLVPLDLRTILASVKKTGHVVVVHEACRRAGIGAEIAATITELAFDYLDAPVQRVGALNTPIPYAKVLEDYVLPDEGRIVEAVRRIL